MSDLRDLLDVAAGDAPLRVPHAGIQRRGRELTRRRWLLTGVALVAAAALLATALPHLIPRTPQPARPPFPTVEPGILKPGAYADPVLIRPVTFVVSRGTTWRASLVTRSSLILTSDDLGLTIFIQHWTGVYEPSTATTRQPTIQPLPDDLIGWLGRHPALRVAEAAAPVLLAGRAAHRISFTLRPDRQLPSGPPLGCTTSADCVILAQSPDIPLTVPRESIATVAVADDDTSGLVVTVVDYDPKSQHSGEANKIVDTLTMQ